MKIPSIITLSGLVVAIGCGKPVEEIHNKAPIGEAASNESRSAESDWPWWRGRAMDNVAIGPTPPTTWSTDENALENILWSVDTPGEGHATPCVVGGRVLLTTADTAQETQSLLCYNRDDGELLWTTNLHRGGFMHSHAKNTQASASPACDGERVFTAFMVQDAIMVSAVDLAGSIAWQTEAGPFKSRHGYGSSPVIHGPLVIVAGDNHGGGFLTALNRKNGEIVWRVQREAKASFATPTIAEFDGQAQLLLGGQGKVIAYDPLTGDHLWEAPGPATTMANTLARRESLVFASGGYPQKGVFAIRAGSDEVVWRAAIKAYVPSPLVVDDKVLVLGDNGVAACLDAATGEVSWRERLGGNCSASPVLHGDLVYAVDEGGATYVFRVAPKFELISKNDLGDGGFASPVICGGRIYLRTRGRLICIGAEAKAVIPDAAKNDVKSALQIKNSS